MTESKIAGDISEMWSLPWHALHRKFASESVAGAVEFSAVRAKYLQAPNGTPSNTWLRRARHPLA
jgi:hypothetical protein